MYDNRALRAYFDAGRHMMSISTQLELPVAIMVTFLGAAMWGTKPGQTETPMSLEELAAATGKTPQTISGHMRYLGARYREGKPGMGLVQTYEHPLNGRCKAFQLTAEGEATVAHLKHLYHSEDRHWA
jgi:predicted transcriptional regulator with HTH domain